MNPPDKPLASALGWRLRATRYLYRSHWYNLRQDDLTLPGGDEIVFTYVEHPGYVTIVPITPDRRILLIRSYRYTVDDWAWELPAGGLGNKADGSLEDAARAELLEETGHSAGGPLRYVGAYHDAIGNTRTRAHVFLATDVRPAAAQSLDNTEVIEVHPVAIAEAFRMARAGEIEDGASALALFLAEPLLKELGYVERDL